MADIKRIVAGNKGIVDTDNSTTSNLGISGVFTGSYVEILDYGQIWVNVLADEDSATDGLVVEFSSDASTALEEHKFTISADEHLTLSFPAHARYYRVIYTNGTTAQTSFNLHTVLKARMESDSTHRIVDALSNQNSATVTKSVLSGIDENSIFQNAKVSSDGRLLVSQEITSPEGTTDVIQTEQSSINVATDTLYTITNGTVLTIQRLSAGSEASTSGSKVELYEDPNGDLSVLNLIAAIYIDGNSDQQDISEDFTGDGTRRIVMRRNTFGGPAREIFGRWQGFET